MKKFLIGCATAAMMLSPAIAEAGGRHGHGNDWIGPVIFGTVLGVIIANSNHGHANTVIVERPPRHRPHHRRPMTYWTEVCERVPHLRQRHNGDYYVMMRHECRMVEKARW